jgi:hypothetical protein
MSAGVSVFAASAKISATTGSDPLDKKPIVRGEALPLFDEVYGADASASKGSGSAQSSLGFLVAPGIQIGSSAYDIQHNSRMGRQVARGADGRVHHVWTHKLSGATELVRDIRYLSWTIGGGFAQPIGGEIISDLREGHMCNIDVRTNQAMVAWRYNPAFANYRTTSVLDFASGTASFTQTDFPTTAPTCPPTVLGGTLHYICPVVAAESDGGGDPLAHVAAMEGDAAANFGNIVYYRGTGDPFTTYTTCGVFIDSTLAISYDIAQSPASGKVAIAYTKGREAGTRDNNDVAYRQSTDQGLTWGTLQNVTNYPTSFPARAFAEVSVLYDTDDCLHIIFQEAPFDSAAGTQSEQETKLKHWDDCNDCITLIVDANNFDDNCIMKAFELNVARINVSQCTVGGQKRIYATYTRYLGTTASPDCGGAATYPNGEVFISASTTNGATWGPPTNVTNSSSNGCTSGNCDDDTFVSTARYNVDSLRIQYMNDKLSGNGVGNDGDGETYNPVMFLSVPCFDMDPFVSLSSTPSNLLYPFNAMTNETVNFTLTLTNAGNSTANWTRSINYLSGSNWLTVPASGSVTAGCTNSAVLNCSATGPATEGLYQAVITFDYSAARITFDVNVDFYVFDEFYLPENVGLRTACARMNVNQASRVGNQQTGYQFSHFGTGNDFIFDGSFVIGTSANDLSWLLFTGGGGGAPTGGNPFGLLYATSVTTIDSNSFANYRVASGTGVNRDSTIAIDVKFYAPKHPDTCEVIVGCFELYAGPKNPGATINNVVLAYATDLDVPDDSAANGGGVDSAKSMVYQVETYPTGPDSAYAAIASLSPAAYGGFVWENPIYVYPQQGYENDSIWNKIQRVGTSEGRWTASDSLDDLNSVLVLSKNLTISPTKVRHDILFSIVEPGAPKSAVNNNPQDNHAKGKKWFCGNVPGAAALQVCAACTNCGDANSDGAIGIADAVFIIQFIFAGGPSPADCQYFRGKGDANGDGVVGIADAVYIIQYIFAGGPAPHCQGA